MLGGASLSLLQALLFLILLPLAGFSFGTVDWISLIGMLAISGLAMTAAGVALAWWVDSTAGYHGLMSVLLLPAWFASGAMFPLPNEGAIALVLRLNPMSYMVDGVRRALYGADLPSALLPHLTSPGREWLVLAVFTAVIAWVSVQLCRRRDA
jgi:ABC-2 type transport system permease protein